MLEQLRKKNLKTTKNWILVLMGVVVIILLITWNSITKLIAGPQQLDDLAIEELSGAYVNGDITAILGNYAYEDYDGGTDNYYILPLGDYAYIGLHVGEEDSDGANQIYDETMDVLMGEANDIYTSMNVTGTINPMSSELYDYYVEWFQYYEFTDDEIEEVALPYVLQVGYIGKLDNYAIYGLLVVGAISILIIIMLMIQLLTRSYLSRIKKFIKKNEDSTSMERIEVDYEGSTDFGSVTIGRLYTHYFQGNKAWILKNSDIIWAYLLNTTHKTYGIKVGSTKQIIIYTKNKKKHIINVKKSDDIDAILNKLTEVNSNIITGYSDELQKLFKKDFNSFVNLKHNRESATTEDSAEYNDTTY